MPRAWLFAERRGALQARGQVQRKQSEEILSVAVRPAAEDRAARHAAAGLAREHQRVAADFGAGVSFLTMRRKMACSAGGKTFAAGFPNKPDLRQPICWGGLRCGR